MATEDLKLKRIALVHDYLLQLGGAERVLKVLHKMFVQAPIYAVVYDEKFVKSFLPGAKIQGTFLQKLPKFFRERYKYFSFLIPSAVEHLDLSEFDIIISSCSAFCKGIITRPDAVHICYCHTPTRFLWDWAHPYSRLLQRLGMLASFARIILHFLRLWDHAASGRVDYFVANSRHVASRIQKYYGRDARVIYPPVEIQNTRYPPSPRLRRAGKIQDTRRDYFLIVSQLRLYKQIDIAIEAFKKLGFPLVIIGEGNDKKRLMKLTEYFENIQFIGGVSDGTLAWYYKNCKALIFASEEDFGMVMVEAMAFGKPVLALRQGGALEIVNEGVTGEFFDDPHPVVLADGVRRLLKNYSNYNQKIIMNRAEEFSREKFAKAVLGLMEEYYLSIGRLACRHSVG